MDAKFDERMAQLERMLATSVQASRDRFEEFYRALDRERETRVEEDRREREIREAAVTRFYEFMDWSHEQHKLLLTAQVILSETVERAVRRIDAYINSLQGHNGGGAKPPAPNS